MFVDRGVDGPDDKYTKKMPNVIDPRLPSMYTFPPFFP